MNGSFLDQRYFLFKAEYRSLLISRVETNPGLLIMYFVPVKIGTPKVCMINPCVPRRREDGEKVDECGSAVDADES